jgi:hypothetical protein
VKEPDEKLYENRIEERLQAGQRDLQHLREDATEYRLSVVISPPFELSSIRSETAMMFLNHPLSEAHPGKFRTISACPRICIIAHTTVGLLARGSIRSDHGCIAGEGIPTGI